MTNRHEAAIEIDGRECANEDTPKEWECSGWAVDGSEWCQECCDRYGEMRQAEYDHEWGTRDALTSNEWDTISEPSDDPMDRN